MLDFKDYIETAFYAESKWNIDNSYVNLTKTARGMPVTPGPAERADMYLL
jgi:Mitochondrial distribution and morphology protein 10